MDEHLSLAGAEALVVELAERLAVDGVAPLGTKALEVEQLRTVTDFLVRHEGDLQRGVRQVGVGLNPRQKRANLGHACLVVCREQRGPVGADDVLPHELREIGHLRQGGGNGLAVDDCRNEVSALVVHDMRLDVVCRRIGRGVDVRTETERGGVLGTCGGWDRSGHIGMLVNYHVFAAQGAKFIA